MEKQPFLVKRFFLVQRSNHCCSIKRHAHKLSSLLLALATEP